jgi:membrane associated rhomboid family serine protease
LIFRGEVWRLATWALIHSLPIMAAITSLAIFQLGSELAAAWGDARLRRYALAMILLGGVATSLVALATGNATLALTGGFGVLDVIGIAWVRQFPQGTLSWFGVEFRGPARLVLILGVNVAFALTFGARDFLPELAICAGAMLYPI